MGPSQLTPCELALRRPGSARSGLSRVGFRHTHGPHCDGDLFAEGAGLLRPAGPRKAGMISMQRMVVSLANLGTSLYSRAMDHLADYSGLFGAAFVSATVLPFQSEMVLVGLLLTNRFPPWLLVLVASIGNTLGSVANWVCGRFIAHFEGRRWFPVSRERMARAETFHRRAGSPAAEPIAAIAADPPDPGRAILPGCLGSSHGRGQAQMMMGDPATASNRIYHQLLANLNAHRSGPLSIRIGGSTTRRIRRQPGRQAGRQGKGGADPAGGRRLRNPRRSDERRPAAVRRSAHVAFGPARRAGA